MRKFHALLNFKCAGFVGCSGKFLNVNLHKNAEKISMNWSLKISVRDFA